MFDSIFCCSLKMYDCTFCRSLKKCKKCDPTIPLSKWANVQKKCKIWNPIFCTFLHICPFLKEQLCNFLKCEKVQFQNLHFFAHFRTSAHFERAVWLHFFVVLWNSVNVRLHILSLFKNVRMCDQIFFTLFKCETKCVIAQLLFRKEQMCKNVRILKSHFFRTLKRAIAHF